ncbi:hypothetical protein PHYC_01889 [Phycisphaerales bacterium]|nr:hypothetical protein PHYC_01889 [Phycisphaerales bacterium]
MTGRVLVLSDGDLPSLVACAAAAEAAIGATDAKDRPIVLPFPSSLARHPGRLASVQRQAELLSLGLLPVLSPAIESSDGEAEIRDLIAAAYGAARSGIDTVVWPASAAAGESFDIDRLAIIADESLLVGRLVALDASRHGVPGIHVETPYLDLTDVQLADLAADLAAPLESLWWWQSDDAQASQARARWAPALERAG